MVTTQSRRDFLGKASLTAAAGVLGARRSLAAEAPPETTTVRLAKIPNSICIAPQYIAEELLRAEGFTDVRFVASPAANQHVPIAQDEVDFSLHFAAPCIIPIDVGDPITVLAGVHVGCFELFANETVRGVLDLKSKSVGVQGIGSSEHVFLASMAAYVGLDPASDIEWVTSPSAKPYQLFTAGEIDAVLCFPPVAQELRASKFGHVVVNSSMDLPWSQYFCCMVAANANYVRDYPAATKRVLRAILKAADICATHPERVARQLVDGGFTPRHDYALQALRELPYDRWREYDPEDTMRFYALRLHEAGMIESTPNEIISAGTDWRFLNELKRELKA